MFQVIVAHSDDIDTEDAVEEILESCEQQLNGIEPGSGLVFCGTEYDYAVMLQLIKARFPDLQLIGCTTDGEMSSSGGYTEDAIVLTLFCSDTIQIRAGLGEEAGSDPYQAAKEAVLMACEGCNEQPKLALVLPDGLSSSAYEVLDGFTQQLGEQVPVVGGMTADRVGGSKETYTTYQFVGEKVVRNAVVALIFSGPLLHSLGVESGWSPIGKKMTVTKSDNNILHELDGRPAFDLYAHYLGEVMRENLAGLGSYPLAVYEPGLERFYLRVARAADPETGQITFLGEIPEGAEVQITQAIRDQVIAGVSQSAESAKTSYPGEQPGLALTFSCTGRKNALGTKARLEISDAQACLGDSIPVAGFYTFGEIGPVSGHSRARYHNTTFVTLLMGEA